MYKYLGMITWPNITYAVSVAKREPVMHAPHTKHLVVVHGILKYLKDLHRKVFYTCHGHLDLEVLIDADWPGSTFDCKSTTGYCPLIGGTL